MAMTSNKLVESTIDSAVSRYSHMIQGSWEQQLWRLISHDSLKLTSNTMKTSHGWLMGGDKTTMACKESIGCVGSAVVLGDIEYLKRSAVSTGAVLRARL